MERLDPVHNRLLEVLLVVVVGEEDAVFDVPFQIVGVSEVAGGAHQVLDQVVVDHVVDHEVDDIAHEAPISAVGDRCNASVGSSQGDQVPHRLGSGALLGNEPSNEAALTQSEHIELSLEVRVRQDRSAGILRLLLEVLEDRGRAP
eukprot:CAMPEP_0170541364 /NCGR_PEP_ID=MMETSP0211-20121228/1116_1 /TAXON_ID=311385 /ORGANISM="Pseudokeronopsis sp., Strain OXSARD2" /LENGTH=145 /DNA_ID=CAMNT_0010844065 /DNA_START=299 /DNA_END=736 /DNA_ORIENTATION=+